MLSRTAELIRSLREKFHKHKMQAKYHNGDITIISNNCLAGVIYNILGLQFSSPTINQWMKMAEYLEFVKDLKYWMSCELIEDTQESEKWDFTVGYLKSNNDSRYIYESL